MPSVSCLVIYGLYRPDPRLITLGACGIAASVLMMVRTLRPRAAEQAV